MCTCAMPAEATQLCIVGRLVELPAPPWLPHLEALHLQDNEIARLAPLHGLANLRILNLSFNRHGDGHGLHLGNPAVCCWPDVHDE